MFDVIITLIITKIMEILTFIMILTTWLINWEQNKRNIYIEAINTIEKVMILNCIENGGGNMTVSFNKKEFNKKLTKEDIKNIKNNLIVITRPEKIKKEIFRLLDKIKK